MLKTSPSATILLRDDSEASATQLNRVMELATKFAWMRNRTVKETIEALFASTPIRQAGYAGDEHMTAKQADVGIGVLGGWIKKAGRLGG